MTAVAPEGTLTFLFTDIEGSTRRWVEHPEAMEAGVARHDDVVRAAIDTHGGYVFATGGDGFGAAFATAEAGLAAAVDIQHAVAAEEWDAVGGIAVRAGLHTGTARLRGGDYFGTDVGLCARLTAAGHGGQVLLSATTAGLVPGAGLIPLGPVRLRDIPDPVDVFQAKADGLASDFGPLRTLDAIPSTLPSPRSSFVGRHEEIEAVRRLLQTHRLVTLTGVGGTGKTRLAVEAAWEDLPGRPGGAYFADLSHLGDGDAIPSAVAEAIDLPLDSGAPVFDQVVARLRDLDALLVVDNCEHLVDDAADVTDRMLARCRHLTVLATSREALEIEGERPYVVPSLAVEDGSGAAIRLFLDRAADARGEEADLDDGGDDAVAKICSALDGIPLAIELAAARTRVLSPAEILDRLDDRFALLSGSRRSRGRQRQHTLEAAIAWSYDLLDDDEQAFFRSLSVLEGDFDLAAVAAVTDTNTAVALELVDSLAAKSLLVVVAGDDTRYRLLETLRQFAQQRLVDAGDAEGARARHLAFYRTRFPERPEAPDGQNYWETSHLEPDRPNLLAALEWADRSDQVDDLALLALGGMALWGPRPNKDEAKTWVDVARARTSDGEVRARLDSARAYFAMLDLDLATWDACTRSADVEGASVPTRVRARVHRQFMNVFHSPHRLLRAADEALATLADEPPGVEADLAGGYCTVMRGFALLSLRRYEEVATELAAATNEGGRSELSAATALHHLGRHEGAAATLAGVDWTQGIVWQLPSRVTFVLVSAPVVGPDVAARSLAQDVRRYGTTSVPLMADSVLVGFGALRGLAGDLARASDLLTVAQGMRTPDVGVHLAEYTAKVEGWPDDEYHERRRALFDARIADDWAARHGEAQDRLLAEELARWDPPPG